MTSKPKHRLGHALLLLKKTGFWPLYCQISTDLDKILHTPIVVRNTPVGRLRPWSARGWLQAKPKRLFFVILVTHPKSYTETTDRCDFGGKPSEWRWGRGCYREKFWNFVAWRSQIKKTAFFRVFRIPFNYPVHSLQETVLPKTNGTNGKPRLWRCAFC